jgi:hypothetical protein
VPVVMAGIALALSSGDLPCSSLWYLLEVTLQLQPELVGWDESTARGVVMLTLFFLVGALCAFAAPVPKLPGNPDPASVFWVDYPGAVRTKVVGRRVSSNPGMEGVLWLRQSAVCFCPFQLMPTHDLHTDQHDAILLLPLCNMPATTFSPGPMCGCAGSPAYASDAPMWYVVVL